MVKISKSYEENVKVGEFIYPKVGITIHSDKEVSGAEVIQHSLKLGQLAKQLVRKELAEIKQEYLAKEETP